MFNEHLLDMHPDTNQHHFKVNTREGFLKTFQQSNAIYLFLSSRVSIPSIEEVFKFSYKSFIGRQMRILRNHQMSEEIYTMYIFFFSF